MFGSTKLGPLYRNLSGKKAPIRNLRIFRVSRIRALYKMYEFYEPQWTCLSEEVQLFFSRTKPRATNLLLPLLLLMAPRLSRLRPNSASSHHSPIAVPLSPFPIPYHKQPVPFLLPNSSKRSLKRGFSMYLVNH